MMYSKLAEIYDALVKDDEATNDWVAFTKRHASGTNILELGCGSCEISNKLAEEGFKVLATDISEEMIKCAKDKFDNSNLTYNIIDMRKPFRLDSKVDTIICYCDSINYLEGIDQIENLVKTCFENLNENGVLLFDMHTEHRLSEFEEEFIEEGIIDDVSYQWSINADNNEIHHHFAFWENDGFYEEYHVQTVFGLNEVINILNKQGFSVHVYVDFDNDVSEVGEKYFIVGRKL